MKTDTNGMITQSYASKCVHSLQINFCSDQLQFIHFLSETMNFGNLNAQAKPDKLRPARLKLSMYTRVL
jgi:hypothetical protein